MKTIIKSILLTSGLLLGMSPGHAQQIYEISAPASPKVIHEGNLNLGGTSKNGEEISFNSYYMSRNQHPQIPIMGEFHYTRYPEAQWEDAILKMKSGGLTVIPTYVFWNLHEEKEGQFNWKGNRNLRKFIQLCQKHEMDVIVRIGPFDHGEIRNGGLPDWLYYRAIDVRSNDARYLEYVRRLYGEIAAQLKGLYFKDGGPIIGIQIENEHQHSAAPWAYCFPGENNEFTTADYDASNTKIGVSVQDKAVSYSDLGEIHMKTLKDMAVAAGMDVPIYTATGWGYSAVIGNEALPVTAAYTYPFWTQPEMTEFCLFKDIHRHPDYAPVRYDTDQFPSFCAEMGVGIPMIWSRRPIIRAEASEALMVRTLGSGANGIGYYMYHGGSTPMRSDGVGFFSDEPMGLTKISYDFQAPVGEYGLQHDSYKALRIVHSFVNEFGPLLAPMETILPQTNSAITPGNRETLRYAVRLKDNAGFVFLCNFQDHDDGRHDQKNLQLKIHLAGETLSLPEEGGFDLAKDESVILPFNFDMEGILLKYSTAQLLTRIDDGGLPHYFFFAPKGMRPEYRFDPATLATGEARISPEPGLESTFRMESKAGKTVLVTTLTREQALNTTPLEDRIIITSSTVLPTGKKLTLLNLGQEDFEYVLYPSAAGMKWQHASVEKVLPSMECERWGERRLSVHMNLLPAKQVREYFLKIDYVGDLAFGAIDGYLKTDHFYYGQPWLIGLNRFSKELKKHSFDFRFRPIRPEYPYLIDLPSSAIPDFSEGPVTEVRNVELIPQYQLDLTL